MPKKRKSGGRNKGGKGKSAPIQCSKCGRTIPYDKAKKVTRYVSLVDRSLGQELRKQGSYIPRRAITEYLCVSCAVHLGKVKIRSKEDRKSEY